ncbi:30S ribosomal protein S3 [Syntrophomonas wolfei]|uniref:Small ribosomal subunit protein uS3 n=1 Tax=Syntrophomonas wolfei subsp. wolfei (strain DSM 2245B / Goettingen) TaxID=335541 RepID=RS3_SYNWW|nr:30S ribosomal protein S3 [Syntrophomonas wolfei]Q0AUI6.1 RecName: Full=Small ribosomal subunit protein uS3; AltName: Full=30S ribosomal protein S3 [Syntrophomonas wolfei subsp. wolfei str. Goettingen G311]ABI69618.1 SSU ribosomal protein S3P [Syntrophomonas wolfei subsp. wolfei str. Goettingen G311]
MGQKVHPKGFRIGIIRDWDSNWYADRDYSELLHEDVKLRKFIKDRFYAAGISKVEIQRTGNRIRVTIHTAKPGIIIGRGGIEVERLKVNLAEMTKKNVNINIQEIRRPEMDAQIVAENVAQQLEKRISFRRAMKQTVGRTMRSGGIGIKIAISGRLGGAEIARTEWYAEGKVPLHTLRADIDYGFAEANTTYGKIGIKVWINRGEILPEAKQRPKEPKQKEMEEAGR